MDCFVASLLAMTVARIARMTPTAVSPPPPFSSASPANRMRGRSARACSPRSASVSPRSPISRSRPIECLSVCKRPCTVALAARGQMDLCRRRSHARSASRGHRDRRAPLRRRRPPESFPGASGRSRSARASSRARRRSRSPQRRSFRLKDPHARQDARHHRHRLSRRRQDDADPPSHGERRRPAARAHHQRIRRRRRRRRSRQGLRRRGLPGRGDHRTRQRLHLLHGRRRFRPRADGADRPRAEARSHRRRDLRARAAEAAHQGLRLAGAAHQAHGRRRRRGRRRGGRRRGTVRRRSRARRRAAREAIRRSITTIRSRRSTRTSS